MDMVAILKHCFHRVKNRLHENDLNVLDQQLPQEDEYRRYMAEYIEEFASPFMDISESESSGIGRKHIFQKYYIDHDSLANMIAFLKEFACKPISEIDLNHHAKGLKAFKHFIRRWENNAQGNDLVELYNEYNEN